MRYREIVKELENIGSWNQADVEEELMISAYKNEAKKVGTFKGFDILLYQTSKLIGIYASDPSAPDLPAGGLELYKAKKGWNAWFVKMLTTDSEYRGKGLAGFFYDYALTNLKLTIGSQVSQSAGGQAMWRKFAENPKYDVWATQSTHPKAETSPVWVDGNELQANFMIYYHRNLRRQLHNDYADREEELEKMDFDGELNPNEYLQARKDLDKQYKKAIDDLEKSRHSALFVAAKGTKK